MSRTQKSFFFCLYSANSPNLFYITCFELFTQNYLLIKYFWTFYKKSYYFVKRTDYPSKRYWWLNIKKPSLNFFQNSIFVYSGRHLSDVPFLKIWSGYNCKYQIYNDLKKGLCHVNEFMKEQVLTHFLFRLIAFLHYTIRVIQVCKNIITAEVVFYIPPVTNSLSGKSWLKKDWRQIELLKTTAINRSTCFPIFDKCENCYTNKAVLPNIVKHLSTI